MDGSYLELQHRIVSGVLVDCMEGTPDRPRDSSGHSFPAWVNHVRHTQYYNGELK